MNNKKEIRIILGQKDLKQKDYDKILELIEPYKETEIEYYNYIKARVLLGKKEYTKAKVILKKVINHNKEHKSAYYHMYKKRLHIEHLPDKRSLDVQLSDLQQDRK